jgi:hypothetical protein
LIYWLRAYGGLEHCPAAGGKKKQAAEDHAEAMDVQGDPLFL